MTQNSLLLFKALLTHENYAKYQHVVTSEWFPRTISKFFQEAEKALVRHSASLTIEELKALYYASNPALSTGNITEVEEFFRALGDAPDVNGNVLDDIVKSVETEQHFTAIAEAALKGSEDSLEVIKGLLGKIEQEPTDDTSVDMRVSSLIQAAKVNTRWTFCIPELQEKIGGLGDNMNVLIAGRPEAGKSLTAITFVFAPGGFLDQGARVLYLNNEEKGCYIGLRGVACHSGIPMKELEAREAEATKDFEHLEPRIVIKDDVNMTMQQLDKLAERWKPDIIVADMLDKVKLKGSFDRDDIRLGRLYDYAREIGKNRNCAFIGVSQVSAEAEGRLFYGFECLAGSKTDKAAAEDLILLIGKESREIDTGLRAINVAKNKISGWHGAVNVMLNHSISRLTP